MNNTVENQENTLNIVKDLALQDLARSGLTEEHANILGIQYLTAEQTQELSGHNFPSYKIPYPGELYRLRLLPRQGAGFGGAVAQPSQRYWQPHGASPELYTVTGCELVDRLVVVEGEKKAAAGCLLANLQCVGIGGVWNFMSRNHGFDLLPEIKYLLPGINEYEIVPDGDFRSNPQVRKAVIKHALAVLNNKPGIKVSMVELPEGDDGKVGLDDYLLEPGADFESLPRRSLSRLEIAAESTWERSDRGLAEAVRFAFDDIFYVPSIKKWIEFNGRGWRQIDDYAARQRLYKINDARIEVARETIEDPKEQENAIKYLVSANNRTKSQQVIDTWKEYPDVASDISEWDGDPMLLGVQNGVLDLTSGDLRPFRHQDRVTLRARVNYNRNARCDLWKQTLNEIFEEDQEMIAFLQRWYGYTLTGETSEHKFMIQQGRGRNGKSLINDVIGWVLGDYYASTSFDTFTSSKYTGSDKGSALAQMVGRRMISASETHNSKYLDTAAIKTVTGDSLIQAKELYCPVFTYHFTGKIVLMTNHAPQVRDDSEGIWERLMDVEFGKVFSREEIDRHRMTRLKEEAEGILAWMVEGCLDWQMHGLAVPQRIRHNVQEWRDSEDTMMDFARERLEFGDTFCLLSDLFEAYKDYMQEDNRPTTWGKHWFSRKFCERFPEVERDNRYRPPNGQRGPSGRVNQVTIVKGVRCVGATSTTNLDQPAGARVIQAASSSDTQPDPSESQ